MAQVNHNQRTCTALQTLGYVTEVVERWNSFARIRQDLFGIFDVLAVGNGRTVGVQITSKHNMASRRRKIEESPYTPVLLAAGWEIEVWGWHKPRHRWEVTIIPVTAPGATTEFVTAPQ